MFLIAQAPAPPAEIVRLQEVRPLPGALDTIPVFNSNSPELVLQEGILLSTFPGSEKQHPAAHLNYSFQGRFDLFAHHIARADQGRSLRTLHLGLLVGNPSDQAVTLRILDGASYVSQPDAPFKPLPSRSDNNDGTVFAGPGDRVMLDLIQDRRSINLPTRITIPPRSTRLLADWPIPVASLTPPLNGRSAYLRLESTGPVYVASLAQYAKLDANNQERSPSLSEWQRLLQTSPVAGPRDRTPSAPDAPGPVIYSRVAGVAMGSRWQATLTDPNWRTLQIPQPGQAFSYGISTLQGGRQGTDQIQTAPLVVRYPDTAYSAHGNYGLEYDLTLPLVNLDRQPRTIDLLLETPIKEDRLSKGGLRFFQALPNATFFRGSVRLRYSDDQGQITVRDVHLVQRRGQQGDSLLSLTLQPGEHRTVRVQLRYPPDATPPQVLTVKTQAQDTAGVSQP
ncbi:DUF3370 domain-containing protein [Synechococcus elongatus]|uniref:DUF3370 domain-containing protein n=1 Tax=Synechococcus elongatus (strain ATCC 33912 / PCC 7942 / FACHB-805) TaxID=1140 RepID=Q31MT5_SYNE7|nr:DUF3370 domain-containing protein [Synechococcus elongatus]ABB57634.1 conserved hypothetical protein [Synechococcus elongatus PCC 7942 = FACHB-805]AJD57975.1 hypothetical protein M744_09080 [Synechococcus elongatus UTEX 2973]MBD2588442.1 DUF3370 domain-containing protein [Synechococcus elongatus FACHB-242]MBD2689395.1 DUF3370 domain-containing protein [Synechococcus elongatus FACHB-1061]MBD2708186.1 DUF3370 domain-containing protein [Synechococcus elongatus PCC 7942 = FACHB-805]